MYLQPGRVRTSGFGFSSVDGWSNLDPFPTGKFVPWMVCAVAFANTSTAPFCNTLSNSFRRAGKVCPHLLADLRRKRLENGLQQSPRWERGGRKQSSCMTQRSCFTSIQTQATREGEGFPILGLWLADSPCILGLWVSD